MTVTLNQRGYDHAVQLINAGKVVLDDRDAWSEHQPSTADQNRYIEDHGFREYGRWFLGIDDSEDEDTKGRYKFPYGDFESVHRWRAQCGVTRGSVQASRHRARSGSPARHVGCLEVTEGPQKFEPLNLLSVDYEVFLRRRDSPCHKTGG